MSDLEEKFNKYAEEWKKHCENNSIHSFPWPYLDCDAFRNIVAMGKDALPLIREAYTAPGYPGAYWCYAILEIVPEFGLRVDISEDSAVRRMIHGFVGLNEEKIQEETIKWLDNYLETK
ncbi:hypothetical protein KY312_01820 [Candidatus Woesearchaeota archaeon]|nr:hypothetical protein [Candidatus Woesearchaeota archaeon]